MKKSQSAFFCLSILFMIALLIGSASIARERISVTTVDFLKGMGLTVNGAGPLLIRVDADRDRIIVPDTLSSSISIMDGKSHNLVNIPLGGRALQHLKDESMTISRKNGEIYLIGTRSLFVVSPQNRSARMIPTEVQFESVAVNDATGNAFLAGRESGSLGFLRSGSDRLEMLKWQEGRQELMNLNQTPPPAIRKVVSDNLLDKVISIDGLTSTLHFFDGKTGKRLDSRPVQLSSGGRWHLAGYDEKDHHLYLVTETEKREVIEAAKIGIVDGNDVIVKLPKFTEGVGIKYNPLRDEVYIPYDNHPSVHVVDFRNGGKVNEIKIPAYGNDASAIDLKNDILYIGSWAFGEVDVIDLRMRKLQKRIPGLGIIPHMFAMAFNPNSNLIYFPKGATAVNGTFGAAISVLDPVTEKLGKIHTGWAPIELIELKERKSFLVFNSENEFAEVRADGSYEMHRLPYDYPVRAIHNPGGDVYLSYGPHQSYWPVVYIWDAKNGILTIDKNDLSFYDRRIPRQAHSMALDEKGTLYFTQNNWGKEEQFLGTLEDEVRVFDAGKRIALGDEVEREITQRLLKFDQDLNRLYLVRVAEKDEDPSLLQVIDPVEKKVIIKIPLGLTASDMVSDDEHLYISNFDSNSVSIINKKSFEIQEIETGEKPLKLCRLGFRAYVINHGDNTLQEVAEKGKVYNIPYDGLPDNLFAWKGKIIIASHSNRALQIIQFDPGNESFTLLCREDYPYGDISFDSRNVSFYVRGQFGDALFSITKGEVGIDGRLWLADFLSGKLFILQSE
ncbi:MAG: hypothetical protein AB1756_08830 [Acidobacteriota bacterium]